MKETKSIVDLYKEVLSGERGRFPDDTWMYKENAIPVVKYLIEERLKWNEEEVYTKLDKNVFTEAKLYGMLLTCFNGSTYAALEAAYPGVYVPWRLKSKLRGYWNQQTASDATKWLVEHKLKWSKREVLKNISHDTFVDNGLGGMLDMCFGGSPYKALEVVYPGMYKPWEFAYVPKGYWTKENGIKATKWLVEEKLQWSRERICKEMTRRVFSENGLRGMVSVCFNNSTYAALEAAYPGEYKPWELKQTPNKFWNEDTAVDATRWLIEEKLGWTVEYAREHITLDTFLAYGLGGMLSSCHGYNPHKALDATYPK